GDGPAQRLDIYRPRGVEGPLPTLLYVHGGGFRILSKDTHWMFGYGFAAMGFAVFSIDYRLAPANPFPAAVEDASEALAWVVAHGAEYGADLSRLVYAGESAGGNLVSSLMVAGCWERPEPLARRIWALDARPVAVLPACGMLQVSDGERYLARTELPKWIRGRIKVVCESYLPAPSSDPDANTLADPLCLLERADPPPRPLPAVFAVCGDADPIREDTDRLGAALARFDVDGDVRFYSGGHAFHAFVWQPEARRAWTDTQTFLERHVSGLRRPKAGLTLAS
ncbi:MAG: alpha/beta hydrolase, partial [Myxococcota bacterium]|nr:alpha/beta hydrolase [Myxococcota bacterium]